MRSPSGTDSTQPKDANIPIRPFFVDVDHGDLFTYRLAAAGLAKSEMEGLGAHGLTLAPVEISESLGL